jgi:predicted NACHT family NTPase
VAGRHARWWSFKALVMAIVYVLGTVIAGLVVTTLTTDQQNYWRLMLGNWPRILPLGLVVIVLAYSYELAKTPSPPKSSEAIKDLQCKLREQVRYRAGARHDLIAYPLRPLGLEMSPRVGLVRDLRDDEAQPTSQATTDIVGAFASSKRRLLIVGEPGSGKTMAAYRLIQYLDTNEVHEKVGEAEGVVGRIPLLVNPSAWRAQESFEAFLVDYLCDSSDGYGVRERTVASAFVRSRRFSLILDGLDEVPAELTMHFSERLDDFVRGLPSEVAVVVTCRTREYEQLREHYPTGLRLVQAVEILPLTSEQLDSALAELAEFDDKDWEALLSQRHLTASQRARYVLSNPLFLNLAVTGRLHPRQLLECDNE